MLLLLLVLTIKLDRDRGQWRCGQEFDDSALLQQYLHKRVQEDDRG